MIDHFFSIGEWIWNIGGSRVNKFIYFYHLEIQRADFMAHFFQFSPLLHGKCNHLFSVKLF